MQLLRLIHKNRPIFRYILHNIWALWGLSLYLIGLFLPRFSFEPQLLLSCRQTGKKKSFSESVKNSARRQKIYQSSCFLVFSMHIVCRLMDLHCILIRGDYLAMQLSSHIPYFRHFHDNLNDLKLKRKLYQ